MKIRLLSTLVLLTTITSGCSFIAKNMYGFKDPDFESSETIRSIQKEWFGNDLPSAVLKYDNWKYNRLYSSPELFVFNASGKHIPYKDPQHPNCNGPAEQFISELHKSRVYHFNDSLTLNKFIEDLDKPGCGGGFNLENDSADFYLFITWASFAGKKIHAEKVKPWLTAYNENQNIKGKLCLINMDLQECWSEAQKAFFNKK